MATRYNIKSGANNKTFYLNGLYFHRGDWAISYGNVEAEQVVGGHYEVIPEGVHLGIKSIYNNRQLIAPRPLTDWLYNDDKTFDDLKDFTKRVGNFIGY